MTQADEPDRDRPTIDEFDRLAVQILGPVLLRLGYADERINRRPLYVTKYFRNKQRYLKIYYELPDGHFDISYMGPGMNKLQNLEFICQNLGRPIARYLSLSSGPMAEHLRAYASLISEQLADVLSGTTEFRYTAADEEALVDQWDRVVEDICSPLARHLMERGFDPTRHEPHASPETKEMAQRIQKKIDRGLAERGIVWRPRQYAPFLYQRPIRDGRQSFDLEIVRRQSGPTFAARVAIRHNRLEELVYEVAPRGAAGRPMIRLDLNSIDLRLHQIGVLNVQKPSDAPAVLRQLLDDFRERGEPFLERVSTLEGTYEALRERPDIGGTFDHIDRWDTMRVICLALMIGKQAKIASAIRSAGNYTNDFGEFRARLQKYFPEANAD